MKKEKKSRQKESQDKEIERDKKDQVQKADGSSTPLVVTSEANSIGQADKGRATLNSE